MNRPSQFEGPLAEGRDLLAVGDEEERDAILLVELLEQSEHLPARYRVEGPGGLVGQDKLGIRDQGPRDGHPLLLPSGELLWHAQGPVSHAQPVEQLLRLLS